jgi:very-short-patch-repair endonuclease
MRIIVNENQLDLLFATPKEIKQNKFISKAKEIHQDSNGKPLYDYSLVDYNGAQNKVKIICPKHIDDWKKETGHIYFEMTPNHHTHRGSKCKFCYLESKTKYTDEDIADAAKKYKTPIQFKKEDFPRFNAALKKGREFYENVTSHFINATESYGETLITNILVEAGLIDNDCLGNSKCRNREKEFEDCINIKIGKYCRSLRFDFYIPEQNTVIEFDGEQHFIKRGKFGDKFETLKENDIIKNEYCLNNNIKLIRIHYDVPIREIETELTNALKSSEKQIFIGPY